MNPGLQDPHNDIGVGRAPSAEPPDIGELLEQARAASEFLKALAHEARLVILCLLVDGERSVTELEQLLSLRQPAISQQLARLRADDLVETRREGKNIYYSLARDEVREVIAALHRAFCAEKNTDEVREPASLVVTASSSKALGRAILTPR